MAEVYVNKIYSFVSKPYSYLASEAYIPDLIELELKWKSSIKRKEKKGRLTKKSNTPINKCIGHSLDTIDYKYFVHF